MKWAVSLLLIFLGVRAFAQSDEDKLYDLLKTGVRKTDRVFTVFHWEPRQSEFSAKFHADTPEGLLNLVRESSRSFVTRNANFGFYVATDPSASRSFGKGDWRLMQIEVPAGWKYLDVREAWRDYLSKIDDKSTDAPACLGSILVSNNGKKLRQRFAENYGQKDCSALKDKVFRRLGVQGIRYTWVVPRLPQGCNNGDRSAFIFTDGSWLNKSNVKAYTVDSRGKDPDRKAIQEIVLTTPPPVMFSATEPGPLWPDLTRKPGLSPETKAWMRDRLLNCGKLGDQDSEANADSDDTEHEAPAQ